MKQKEFAEILDKNGIIRKVIKPGYKELWYYSPNYPLKIKYDNGSIYILNRGRCIKSTFDVQSLGLDIKILLLCLKLNTAQLRTLFPGAILGNLPQNTFDYFREKQRYIVDSGIRATQKDILCFEILRLYDNIHI